MVYAKRRKTTGRYSGSRSRGSRGTRPRSTLVNKNWPTGSYGMGPRWDPFPAQATAVMRYSQTITLTPTAGSVSTRLFRANGIYDPDATGTGHQPYGHDIYAQIYNHYNVRSATITVTPTASSNGIIGCAITDDATVSTDYDAVREQKGTRLLSLAGGSASGQKLTNYYNRAQIFPANYQRATVAAFQTDPGELTFFQLFVEGPSSTIASAGITLMVNIEYVVDMFELKDLGRN